MKMSGIDWVAYILLVIGGINWGLVGLFDFNLVSSLFGAGTFTAIIYDLVGLSALWSIWTMAKK